MINIILLLVTFFEFFICIFVLTQNPKELTNRIFSILAFIAAIWTFSNYMADKFVLSNWLNITYVFGALLICAGLIWTIVITEEKFEYKRLWAFFLIGLFFSLTPFGDKFIIKSYVLDNAHINKSGWELWVYGIYYITYALLIIWKLIGARKNTQDDLKKNQLTYILIGASIALGTTALNSIFLPYYSTFLPGAIDDIGFLFFLIFVVYSIFRHKLFNIRVAMVEIIVLGLWMFILIRILLAKDFHDMIVESIIFVILVILGIIVIQNVLQGIKQRKEIEELTKKLEEAYFHLNKKWIITKD